MSMLFFADCVNKLTSVFCATITRHARVCRGYLTFEPAAESLQKTRPVMIVAESQGRRGFAAKEIRECGFSKRGAWRRSRTEGAGRSGSRMAGLASAVVGVGLNNRFC